MAFAPGNKLGGRKKGSKNKTSERLRKTITAFVKREFKELEADFEHMTPTARAKILIDLIQYTTPKLQATTIQSEFETMPEEQLDEIIEQLKAV